MDIHLKHKVFDGCLNCRSTGVLSRSISVFFLSRLEKVPRYFWYRVSLFSVFSFSYVRNTRLLRYRSTTDKTNLPATACSKLPLLRKTNNRDVVRQCATHKKKGHGDPGCTDLWILWVFKFSVVNTPVEIITVYTWWVYHADLLNSGKIVALLCICWTLETRWQTAELFPLPNETQHLDNF